MYIPLKNFTKFTIQESILQIEPWIDKLTQHRIPAVACVDRMNMFGLVQFYQLCLKKKIKPLLGISGWLRLPNAQRPIEVVLLARNYQGYQDISSFLSDYYQTTQDDLSFGLNLLEGYTQNVFMIVDQNAIEQLGHHLKSLKELFEDRLFIGLQRYPNDTQSHERSIAALNFAHQHELTCVAANSVYFLSEEDFETQQIKYCIQHGEYLDDPHRKVTHHKYQRVYNPDEMQALFKDCPIVLKNTLHLAASCNVTLVFGNTLLPAFADEEQGLLRELAAQGLKQRLEHQSKDDLYQVSDYEERLSIELDVICQMGFSGYFLIVADFIRWAKSQQIPVGPGRGSGAGSLVAYALGITELNPLTYKLLFERFLNPERVSMPDFDIDFCMDKRDQVIHYVQQQYGEQSVSQIATFGTMAAKAVVRDVGRVLHHPYGFVDKIAKMIPNEVGISLSEAIEKSDVLKAARAEDETVAELIEYALKLEGLPRNVGKHAGGVVIAPGPLKRICPLYNEPGAPWHPITQLDKDDIEKMGLIKFDFLGLKTLTVLDWSYRNAEKIGQALPPLDQINLADRASYTLLISGKTIAVFQLESRGMRDLIVRLQPDCFEDVIALVALFRPGPLQSGMVDDFIARKHGKAAILYPHPLSEPILKPTYGVILYQEQVMQIAQVLASYTLGSADLLRRAMGKKKPEEMAQQRSIFVQGALNQGIDEETSSSIFDLIEKFAGYGFNKSHSAAYALIAFQTLYLKAHAPAPFLAANMTAEEHNLDKILILVQEARSMGLDVLAPNINHSELDFVPVSRKEICYGLAAIKGVGRHALEPIIEERKQNGLFHSFRDFVQRTASLKPSKKTFEALIFSGCFDIFEKNRQALLLDILPPLLNEFDYHNKDQGALFGFEILEEQKIICTADRWSLKIIRERDLLGLAFSGHLLDPFFGLKQNLFSELVDPIGPNPRICLVLVGAIKYLTTVSGKKLAIVTLLGRKTQTECVLGQEKNLDLLTMLSEFQVENTPIVATLKPIDNKNRGKVWVIDHVIDFESYCREKVQSIELNIPLESDDKEIYNILKWLPTYHWPADITLHLIRSDGSPALNFGCQGQGGTGSYLEFFEKVYGLLKVKISASHHES